MLAQCGISTQKWPEVQETKMCSSFPKLCPGFPKMYPRFLEFIWALWQMVLGIQKCDPVSYENVSRFPKNMSQFLKNMSQFSENVSWYSKNMTGYFPGTRTHFGKLKHNFRKPRHSSGKQGHILGKITLTLFLNFWVEIQLSANMSLRFNISRKKI